MDCNCLHISNAENFEAFFFCQFFDNVEKSFRILPETVTVTTATDFDRYKFLNKNLVLVLDPVTSLSFPLH